MSPGLELRGAGARVRRLVSPRGSKPVWTFVEIGHPASEDHWPSITPPQIRAAVWHSLIAGARGITYFNHSFGGPCRTQHALRDPCYARARATVKATNRQIKALAPVLNAPFVTSRWTHSPATKAMVKWSRGHFYVFAGSAENVSSTRLVLDPLRRERHRHRRRREAPDSGPQRTVQRLVRRRQRDSHLSHRRWLGLRSEPSLLNATRLTTREDEGS